MKITKTFGAVLLGLSILVGTSVVLFAKEAKKTAKVVVDPTTLPRSIESGEQGPFHVQGIAVDLAKGHIYMSFTTTLVKLDLQGNLIGSVTGLTGHMGCLTRSPYDGRIYGSIEYKNDEIGRGIRRTLNAAGNKQNDQIPQSCYYLAIFDGDKIVRPNMDAEKDGVMTTVYLKEVIDDCMAKVTNQGRTLDLRFGCLGIDGVAFGPRFGAPKDSKNYLYVAYGLRGDTTRTDNDYQILLEYDIKNWKQYERSIRQDSLHTAGPASPLHKYFVRTGNTTYGVQNLAYDPASGNWYIAVYRGQKSWFPNYGLFVIDGSKAPLMRTLEGVEPTTTAEILTLLDAGLKDSRSGIRGWQFDRGTTGIAALGNGYFYISHNGHNPVNKQESDTVRLYRWTGAPDQAFERIP